MEDYKTMYEQALDNFKKIRAANKDNKELVDFIEYNYPELKENKDEEKPNGGIVSEDFNEGEGFYKVNLAYLNKEQVIEIEELVKKWNPEFQEGDDEKIRKGLIDFLKSPFVNENITDEKVAPWIAWLEKQGKPQIRTGSEWVRTIDDACEHRYAEEYAHGECCHQQFFRWGFQEGVDWLEKQSEQKSAEWHREDEQNLNVCLGYIPDEFLRRWLKDVVYEKYDKPTWSEEDEQQMKSCFDFLDNISCGDDSELNDCRNWLKSLKDRYTWKPSDEQMEALNDAVRLYKSTHFDSQHYKIESLYECLKKLREK